MNEEERKQTLTLIINEKMKVKTELKMISYLMSEKEYKNNDRVNQLLDKIKSLDDLEREIKDKK